ncbi:hypothetical protein JHX44_07740 [Escherichia coli]|nr:hypothetical protein [Escherichia coli]ELO4318189.1 hypothetical protein [Escherichia coli]MBS9545827.1 hypothetical protein [Escherichia coli]MBS9564643.1 hypothetical protein [Escherichia coli]MEB6787966.1 hypothetical protein [Escherichia coli]
MKRNDKILHYRRLN